MISIGQCPSTALPCNTDSCLPWVSVASTRKFCLSTGWKSRASPSIARRGTAPSPCTWASSALPVGTWTVSASPARRNCGARPVYSGGVSHRSKLAATAAAPPAKFGRKARATRSRQSAPASIAPSNNRIAKTERTPQGSRRANPAAGQPTRRRRAASSMRRRCAAQSPAASRSSGALGRSAKACNGRWARPLASSIRRRAAIGSFHSAAPVRRRTPQATAPTKAIPNPASTPTCPAPGSQGSRSNSERTANPPSTHSAGQAAGQTRSHSRAARASRRRRTSRRPPCEASRPGRSVMRHLAYAPAPRPDRRASREWRRAPASPRSSAAPGSRHNGFRSP